VRARHIIPIAAFFALLCLPAAQSLTGRLPVRPLDENRKLAPPPHLSLADPHRTLIAAKKWFEDHYGLRPFLIRAKAQIDYSLFGTSDRVHIGRDGFLFYRSVLDDERFVVDALLRRRMADVLRGIAELRDELASRGKRLVVLIAPNKEVVYPEMVPASAPRMPPVAQIDLLRARLGQMPGILYVDPLPILADYKKSALAYFRTDAHWTLPAAFMVGKAVVDSIAADDGRPSPWRHPLEVKPESFSGGEARAMPLFRPPGERIDQLVPTAPNRPVSRLETNAGPFQYLHWYAPGSDPLLPCLVAAGDSFWLGVDTAGTPVYFQGYYRAIWNSFSDFKKLLDAPAECKFFVLEFVQGNRTAIETLADYRR
jgi:hypothetical protein